MQREARSLRCELLTIAPRLAALLLGLVALVGAGTAHAHGSAPAAIEVLATDDGRTPTLLALTSGLARREPGGTFSFVCPAAWGSGDAVLAARGDMLAAVSRGRLLVGESTCGLGPVVPGAADDAMVDVVASAGALLAIGKGEGTSRVYAVVGSGAGVRAEIVATAADDGPDGCELDAIVGANDGSLVGACAAPRPALFLPGIDPPVRPFVLPFAVARLVPRVVTTDTITLLALAAKGSFVIDLGRSETSAPPRIAGPFATVLGPARLGDAMLAVIDGHLWRQREATWAKGAAVPYTCLSQVGDAVFACSLGSTVRLERSGDAIVEAEAVFSLAMLGEPTDVCAAGSGEPAVCRGEWGHFGAEAGLLSTTPATSPTGSRGTKTDQSSAVPEPLPADPDAGCAVSVRPRKATSLAVVALALALAGTLAVRRRARSRGWR